MRKIKRDTFRAGCATIDVGFNSVLIHIVEKDREGDWKIPTNRTEFSRLGEGLRAINDSVEKATSRRF